MNKTIFITQGIDYSSILRVLNPDGTAINIAGYSFNSAIRQNPFSNLPSDILTINVTSAANGNLTVSYPAANSSNLQYGQYIYIVTASNNNVTSVLMKGELVLSPNPLVTQPALPNVAVQILDDVFYPVFNNQNSFYLSFAPANTSNVTIIYNGVAQTNSSLIYTISGQTLFFNNNGKGGLVGDQIQATETIPSNE